MKTKESKKNRHIEKKMRKKDEEYQLYVSQLK